MAYASAGAAQQRWVNFTPYAREYRNVFALKWKLQLFLLFSASTPSLAQEELGRLSETTETGALVEEEPSGSNTKGPSEIVVNGRRRGDAEVAPEIEIGEQEIASHGSSSIQDLLTRLSPFINDDGTEPVLLINGKLAGYDRSILIYPTEALERLAVLKPEAAALYGGQAGKRVVNLVLKKSFSMLSTEFGIGFATGGGQYDGKLSANRTAISGNARWNAQARLSADSAFKKTSRNLPAREGIFDSVGYVTAPYGGEIDPALSLLAGQYVTVAGIPTVASTDAPIIGNFSDTANRIHAVNPNRFETLQPTRRHASLSFGLTRPIGDFSASVNVSANQSRSEGLRGLPMASVLIPTGHPKSPFANDVLLIRPLAGERALRIGHDATSVSTSVMVNGKIGDWQVNFGTNYSHNWSSSFLDEGINILRVQQLLDTGDPHFNPYGLWDDELLIANKNRTQSENINFRLNVRKSIINLPAGPLTWNISANAGHGTTVSLQNNPFDASITRLKFARRQSNGQIALSVPISNRGEVGPSWLGDLTIDLLTSVQSMSYSRKQMRYGVNINWSPWSIVQLQGAFDYTEASPTFDQLDAPLVTTVRRLFDHAHQKFVDVTWMSGGNPDLKIGSRQNLSFTAAFLPLGDQRLALNFGYRQSVARGAVSSFPELIPAIEAAFPERVTRGAGDQLMTVDARAINLAHDVNVNLTSGIALRLPAAVKINQNGGSMKHAPIKNPWQFSLALNHDWRLKSDLLTRKGLAVIDQIRDSGQSRHSLSLHATVGKRGIGANLIGNWSNPAQFRQRSTNAGSSLFFRQPLIFNVSTFLEPDQFFDLSKDKGLFNQMKVSIDIHNIFNTYRRVTSEDGSLASGYSRDEVDPLGRLVRISVRKSF